MSNGPEPLDQSVTIALLKSAEEFESAVLKGQLFFVAIAAQALAQNLRRFFPKELSNSPSLVAESDRASAPFFLPTALYPNPDREYSERVRASVRRFKESLLQGNRAAALEAVLSTGIITAPSPQGDLDRLELEAARAPGAKRLLFLPKMAKLALWMGDADKAERFSSEILRLTQGSRSGLDRDEAIHDGNMVLGLLDLRRGDKEGAKKHLLASAHTDGSLEMTMIGPNLTLANELLRAGEREAVLEYLETCRAFWSGGRKVLERWISQIRSGEDPAFDPLYFSS